MQNFLQNNKFFVYVVTLCDIFYSRFKRFFGLNVFLKKDFSLKHNSRIGLIHKRYFDSR